MDTTTRGLDTLDEMTSTEAPLLDLERFLPYRLSLLANTVSRVLARLYDQEHGLTVAEWRLIAILARFGPLSANDVCDRSAMDKVRVSRAVSRATGAGLVDRQIDSQDRRRSVLSLTPRGRAIHDHVVPLALDRQEQVLAGLSEAEREQLSALLDKLLANATRIAPKEHISAD